MTVDVNYWWIIIFAVAIVLLIRWMIRHDREDEKKFTKEIIQSELKASKHKENKDTDVTL